MILYSLVPLQRINASTAHTMGPQRHEMKYFVPFVAIGRAYHRVSSFSGEAGQYLNASIVGGWRFPPDPESALTASRATAPLRR
jgi:hypothetical protein